MTEHVHNEPMFLVGAQVTADGDMLPKTFTVFSAQVPPERAVQFLLGKLAEELQEMGLEEGQGEMMLQEICCWDGFANIPLPDDVKLAALSNAIVAAVFEEVAHNHKAVDALVDSAFLPFESTGN